MRDWLHTMATFAVSLPRRFLLAAIWVYQRTLSPVFVAIGGPGAGCRFQPSCSHYAADALRTHGALAGTWLAARRLCKCTPFHPGGFDPVPPRRLTCVRSNPPPSLSHG